MVVSPSRTQWTFRNRCKRWRSSYRKAAISNLGKPAGTCATSLPVKAWRSWLETVRSQKVSVSLFKNCSRTFRMRWNCLSTRTTAKRPRLVRPPHLLVWHWMLTSTKWIQRADICSTLLPVPACRSEVVMACSVLPLP